MPPTHARSIRLLPELRAVHLERLPVTAPADVLFFQTKYDLGDAPLPAGVRRVTLAGAVRAFWRSPAERLEMPEPLWMRFLPAQPF
ncbi:hypothetical protein GCM10025867_04230 [Frondihabitans sucicola]|uniref:Uncharacterized protein n=1 Tax=Frondihabitans sucicola TaxID=1268041 RepID=A0ABM8GIH3_9MICO|nr:hypothetical protein [Frondihabitans sucicola]BDZ48182.1 hypothetical protein GCM10025867_04230 [Frondihabitans sucicola]